MSNIENEGIITFRDLVLEVRNLFVYLLRRWYIILAGVLLFAGSFFLLAYSDTPLYQAELTFTVKDSEAQGGGGGVLAQLGLGQSSSSTAGVNLEKLEGLASSQQIIRSLLLTPVSIDGREDYVGNHLIDIYQLRQTDWEGKPQLENFNGFTSDTFNLNDYVENQAAKSLKKLLLNGDEEGILFFFDPISTIHSITAKTPNADLSQELVKAMYNALNILYVNNAISKQERTVNVLQHRADSLNREIATLEITIASNRDRGRDIVLRSSEIGRQRAERELSLVTAAYLETFKSLNSAKFTLEGVTPSFLVIDDPVPPFDIQKLPLVKFTIIGAVVGFIVSITFLVLYRAVKNALKS